MKEELLEQQQEESTAADTAQEQVQGDSSGEQEPQGDQEEGTREEQTDESQDGSEDEVTGTDREAYSVLREMDPDYDGDEKGAMTVVLDRYRQFAKDSRSIAEAIDSNPEMADVLTAVADGVPFRVALATYMDLDDIKPMEGDADYERYVAESQNRKTMLKQQAEQAQREAAEMEVNKAETVKTSEAFFKEKGMDDGQRKAFVDFFDGILDDVTAGKVSKSTLESIYNAFVYQDAVEDAKKQGEINGRNQKIEAKRQTRETEKDGVPTSGQSVGTQEESPIKRSRIFECLNEDNNKYYNG